MGSAANFEYATLKDLLKGTNAEVLLPDDGPNYEKSIVRWSEHCIKRAAAVVLVTSADDVSATLAQINKYQIPFTVKGGGHNTSGAASIEDGIVIDLSKMRKVTVDPQAKTIMAEGGTIWEDVDVEAAKYGLATVGGTVNHTGVGGLTLGGGYGYLSGKYGLVIDNLLSVEIVLASGEQVVASLDSHPDLFWAIRGAGANFGVVTSFTFQAHEQENHVFSGPLIFFPDKLPQITAFANKFHETTDGNQTLFIIFSNPPPNNVPIIIASIFHNGTEKEARDFFADLYAIGPLADHTAMMPYEKLNGLQNGFTGFEGRKLFGGGAFKLPLEPAFVQGLHTEYSDFIAQHENLGGSMVIFEIIPYKKTMAVSNAATSFSNRGDYYNVCTIFKWFDPSLDVEHLRTFSRQLLKKTSEKATDRSKDGGVGQYAAYATMDVEAKEIFGANVKRLEDLKAKYDPDNLFSHGTRLTPRPLVVVN